MFEHLKVWVNGKTVPWGQATVHIMSHSFSRGSAMFDVFGIHQGPAGPVAFRMDKHLDRLFRSAELLGMEMAYTKDDVAKAVAELVKANNIGRGLAKILAYYSEEAVISLVMDSKVDLGVFAIPETDELGLDKAEPISICLSKWRKLHPATVPVEAKACANYLNGVLSRKDAVERGFDLAIMLTTDGHVAEGAIESVFMVKDGVVKTPPLGNILQSVTRMSILEALRTLGIETSEEQITPEAFLAADEIFTCHTGIKVTPVKRIEDRVLGEAPGPVTLRISELMKAICEFRDDRFKDWFQPLG